MKPNGKIPLLVGANRDERIDRPSSHFELRNKGKAFYPLDVGGGTWIGVNDYGLFAAITNRDDDTHVLGRESRGKLVTRALEASSVSEVSEWADALTPSHFNGFRLIVADILSCVVWGGDGVSSSISRTVLTHGLHIITGFGLDTWEIPRCSYVKRAVTRSCNISDMKKVLSYHETGHMEDDVCVHDPRESHVTVSSCVIQASPEWRSFRVEAVKTAPCFGKQWDSWTIER